VAADVVISPAATVIVLRDGPAGPEVFMVRRHHAVAFMAGAHVFPGGRVDPGDHGATDEWCDGRERAMRQLAGVAADAGLAYHIAAARELFEEAGVLLARNNAGTFVSLTGDADRERFLQHRADVHGGRRTLREVVTSERLRVALDALMPYAHWVTPPVETRRFDTRFFVTRVPPEQAPVHDDTEATDSVWTTPADALGAARRQEIVLPPPTWTTLRELESFGSVADVLSWTGSRTIERREPKLIEEHGTRMLVLPGDPLNPQPGAVPFETRFVWTDDRWRPEA
jgi:8-oxo-dGTP pyrophosphatase MutT (NUDIX family)